MPIYMDRHNLEGLTAKEVGTIEGEQEKIGSSGKI